MEDMNIPRPDLTDLPDNVAAYIEALEAELLLLKSSALPKRAATAAAATAATSTDYSDAADYTEPPTTINLITISAAGLAKRTPRHYYTRQRRGGMGIFDLDTAENDPPAFLVAADASQSLLLFTSLGRTFRLPVSQIPETAVRARGQSMLAMLPFPMQSGERLAAVLPDSGGAYIALVSERGWTRRIRAAYLGEKMLPGTSFHDVKEGGALAAASWTSGSEDLFIVTREGSAIRFDENQASARGVRGLRLGSETDRVMGIAALPAGGGVLLIGPDGKGTIRLMSGFSANKAPGAGGKVAMKAEQIVGMTAVTDAQDVFIISRLGKLIRFAADEIPAKEGVVQGVNCMSLRADEVTAVTVSG
jgi:DNA gyrase subunit A